MWDSDSDDGFAAGGFSMKEFERKNALLVQSAFLALEEKLYNEVVDEEEEEEAGGGGESGDGGGTGNLGGGDSVGEVARPPPGFSMDDDYSRGGWAPAPPPPSPHLEWQRYPNLRVRGTAMVLHRGGAPETRGEDSHSNSVGDDPSAAAPLSSSSSSSSSSPRSAPPPTPAREDMQQSQCPRPHSADVAEAAGAPAPGDQECVEEIIAIHGTLGELQD